MSFTPPSSFTEVSDNLIDESKNSKCEGISVTFGHCDSSGENKECVTRKGWITFMSLSSVAFFFFLPEVLHCCHGRSDSVVLSKDAISIYTLFYYYTFPMTTL